MKYSFEYFEPLDGEPPNYLEGIFYDLIFRARKILHGRTKKELKVILQNINKMFEGAAGKAGFDIILDDIKKGKSGQNPKYEDHIRTTPADELIYARQKYKLDVDEQFDWPDYFAVLALAAMSEAIYLIEFHRSRHNHKDSEEDRYEIAGYGISDMMAAVNTAEMLMLEKKVSSMTKEEVERNNKEKISLRAQKGGIEKNKGTKIAIAKLVDYHDENPQRSKRQNTKIFIQKFPKLVAHLSTDNVFNTMYNNLNKERPTIK